MITLFVILMFMFFGKMIMFGIKAAWGLGKFVIGLISRLTDQKGLDLVNFRQHCLQLVEVLQLVLNT